MKIIIKSQGTLAIYEQIVNQLKNAIVTGELSVGEALPSIRSLASSLEVSVITTKRAYEVLEKEGLIRSVAGKGFYVCDNNKEYLKEKQLLSIEEHFSEVLLECKKIGLSQEEVIDMVSTLYSER
ncbi:MAG: GntR family transcriptional regulator [bacterium]|nr:GntR family transcriptional regulator [bacterium]